MVLFGEFPSWPHPLERAWPISSPPILSASISVSTTSPARSSISLALGQGGIGTRSCPLIGSRLPMRPCCWRSRSLASRPKTGISSTEPAHCCRKLYQNAPLNKKEVRTELYQERIPAKELFAEERIEEVQAVHEVLAELGPEDAALLQAMMQYESPTEAARALGIPRQTFVDRLDKAKRRFAELYES